MNDLPATDHLPYPTPQMEGLFPRLCSELTLLRQLLGTEPVELTVPMGNLTHPRMLETVREMFFAAVPALSLFLAHPTRRLSVVLIKAAAEATAAVAWLAQNPPTSHGIPHVGEEYAACCERIQSGIADWRLSVELKCAWHDLDVGPAETVH
jgi:hypothetical protein